MAKLGTFLQSRWHLLVLLAIPVVFLLTGRRDLTIQVAEGIGIGLAVDGVANLLGRYRAMSKRVVRMKASCDTMYLMSTQLFEGYGKLLRQLAFHDAQQYGRLQAEFERGKDRLKRYRQERDN